MAFSPPSIDSNVQGFMARLNEARSGVLMLDYDGTLAPFAIERHLAFPYLGVRERLDCLMAAGTTRVVIVSGRPASELPGLLQLARIPEVWGSHGWERVLPDGRRWAAMVPYDAAAALQTAQGLAQALERGGLRLEAKPASLAAHWRGLPVEHAQRMRHELRGIWSVLAGRAALEFLDFDGGLELRITGRSKADAVELVLAESAAHVPAAYLGDDLTDEDAFMAIDGRGLAILVRPEPRRTRAHAWLRPPHEVLDFIDQWLRASSAAGRLR